MPNNTSPLEPETTKKHQDTCEYPKPRTVLRDLSALGAVPKQTPLLKSPPAKIKLAADGATIPYQDSDGSISDGDGSIYLATSSSADSADLEEEEGDSCMLPRPCTSSVSIPLSWNSSSLDMEESEPPTSSDMSKDSLNRESSAASSSTAAAALPTAYGMVRLNVTQEDEFAPQIMFCEEVSPVYSSVYDEYGMKVFGRRSRDSYSHSHQSKPEGGEEDSGQFASGCYDSWDYFDPYLPDGVVRNEQAALSTSTHVQSQDLIFDQASKKRLRNFVWSDCGMRPTSHDEFWKSKTHSRNKGSSLGRRETGKQKDFQKYASESNIEDALEMLETGLRKIPKDTNFTSEEESPMGSNLYEDHIYQSIDGGGCDAALNENIYEECCSYSGGGGANPESGFFSYQNYEEDFFGEEEEEDDGYENHVTLIPVNQCGDSGGAGGGGGPKSCGVTVNGRQIFAQSPKPKPSSTFLPTILESRSQTTIIPIRVTPPLEDLDEEEEFDDDNAFGQADDDAGYEDVSLLALSTTQTNTVLLTRIIPIPNVARNGQKNIKRNDIILHAVSLVFFDP